jgi:thiamine biosynthesis lipoprotein
MGTLFHISLYTTNSTSGRAAAQAAFRRIADLDNIMSDYQADSELMRLCDQPFGKPVPVSSDLFAVIQKAQRFSELSYGAFDVTVGPYVRLWRFARKRKVLPTPSELAAARVAVGWKKLRLNAPHHTITLLAPNMRLDLGGIAKGYAADQALALLRSKGITRALVAASGDIALGDPPPGQPGWKIGTSDIDATLSEASPSTPDTRHSLLLQNAGISTSGDTEQFIEIGGVRYSHILDPTTGLGLTNRIQVTIVAPKATTTDGLATAVSILGVERGLKLVNSLPHVGAFILTKSDDSAHSYESPYFRRLVSTPSSRRP